MILHKNLEEAAKLGYTFNTGPELEFFVFKRNYFRYAAVFILFVLIGGGAYYFVTKNKINNRYIESAELLKKHGVEI